MAPSMGFPMVVREDGTISLPLVPPIEVSGLTLSQAEEEIHNEYNVKHKIQIPGHDRILLTLIEPRRYNVIVVREDGVDKEGRPLQYRGQEYSPTGSILEPMKTGVAQSVELKAYENDVLHALAESGGHPRRGRKGRNQDHARRVQERPRTRSVPADAPRPRAAPKSPRPISRR